MQLMCDILVHDTKTSACLNDEQKSLLATFEHKGGNVTMHRSSKRSETVAQHWRSCAVYLGRFRVHLTLLVLWFIRLSVIDESSFMSVCHSDISYDRTDDDVVSNPPTH